VRNKHGQQETVILMFKGKTGSNRLLTRKTHNSLQIQSTEFPNPPALPHNTHLIQQVKELSKRRGNNTAAPLDPRLLSGKVASRGGTEGRQDDIGLGDYTELDQHRINTRGGHTL